MLDWLWFPLRTQESRSSGDTESFTPYCGIYVTWCCNDGVKEMSHGCEKIAFFFLVHLERFQQTPMAAVLQLVLLPHLPEPQHRVALSVQLIVQVVQQGSSGASLQSHQPHTKRLDEGSPAAGRRGVIEGVLSVWRALPPVWQIYPICSRRSQRWSALLAGIHETQDPDWKIQKKQKHFEEEGMKKCDLYQRGYNKSHVLVSSWILKSSFSRTQSHILSSSFT